MAHGPPQEPPTFGPGTSFELWKTRCAHEVLNVLDDDGSGDHGPRKWPTTHLVYAGEFAQDARLLELHLVLDVAIDGHRGRWIRLERRPREPQGPCRDPWRAR